MDGLLSGGPLVVRVNAKNVYVETFGCQMNKMDTELVLGALLREGYAVTDDIRSAGVIFYNTCSVRQHAEDRVWSHLGRLRHSKRRNRDLVIGVLGCMAQKEKDRVLNRAPHVDLVLGTRAYNDLPRLVEEVRRSRCARRETRLDQEIRLERDVRSRPDRHRAFVTVMRGCSYGCTYCVVPYTRGPEESRPLPEVVEEVHRLVDDGVIEITLLGQTVDAYGRDRGGPDLADLLEAVAGVSGLRRVRFITSHPRDMSDRILGAVATIPEVCPYLHLPLQSGSDRILAAMKRLHTVDEYRRLVDRARELVPGVEIATDFIVGFPGETEEDDAASLRVLEEVGFQSSFVFQYSPRPSTVAWRWPDDVPADVKRRRCIRMLDAQTEVSRRRNTALVGSIVEVLVEGPSTRDASRFTGRTPTNHIVVFPPEAGEAGAFARLRIVDATPLTLHGLPLEQAIDSCSSREVPRGRSC